MKTFSFQSGGFAFPRIAAVAVLLLVAGCSDSDDNEAAAGPNQAAANGVWTGTIDGENVVALLSNGEITAFSDHSVTTQADAKRYSIPYRVAAGDTELSGDADGIHAHDYSTGMALSGLGAFTATLATAAGGATTLEGRLGDASDPTPIMLTRVADSNANPTDQDPFVDSWTDALSWTKDANAGGGITTLTIDDRLMLTATTAGTGCQLTEAALAPATNGVHAYAGTAEIETCAADTDLEGEYSVTVFLGSTNPAADATTNDVLYMVAAKTGTPPVYRVVVAR